MSSAFQRAEFRRVRALGFSDKANLDEGAMRPTAFALVDREAGCGS